MSRDNIKRASSTLERTQPTPTFGPIVDSLKIALLPSKIARYHTNG